MVPFHYDRLYLNNSKRRNIHNKRPMGHIAHLGNQLKSMNTFKESYYYIYYKIGTVVREEKIFSIS